MRLNADGSTDPTFNTNLLTSGPVYDIAVLPDGKIIGAGQLQLAPTGTTRHVVKFNQDGSVDNSFQFPSMAGTIVRKIVVQADGKILVGGAFTNIGGAARNRIARLHQNGSIDLTFNVGAGADGNVNVIALDASGKVLAGGVFIRYDNTPRSSIVRLLNNAAPRPTPFDYDGDGKSDLSVFRPSSGFWYIVRASGVPSENFDALQFGANGDVIVPADYDGDGKTDFAVFRPAEGIWYLLRSTLGFTAAQFGANGDAPTPNAFIR